MVDDKDSGPGRKPAIPLPLLERYRLGELPPEQMDQLSRRLEADPAARASLAALEADDASLLEAQPPAAFIGRLRLRAHGEAVRRGQAAEKEAARGSFGRLGAWAAPLAGAGGLAVLALLAVPGLREDPCPTGPGCIAEGPLPPGVGGEDRIKGLEAGLKLYRRVGEGSELLEPGAAVAAGETLRIEIRAAGRTFGAVLSVDGNGHVTRHYPPVGDSAAVLDPGAMLLPEAFELDDAPEFEHFILIAGDRPFPLGPYERRLRDGDSLFPPPADLILATVPLRKRQDPKGKTP